MNKPQRYGKIVDGKYEWDNSRPFPEYYKNGNDFIKLYRPNDVDKSFDFYMGDNEENYIKNLKKQPNDWHYRTKNVTYTLNSLGYRTKEFDEINWKESIVVFGCSCTFGVGVSDDETLTYHLEKIIGREVINLGIPGGSNQFILDMSSVLMRKYGIPYGIIMMWTTPDRFPYYYEHYVSHVGPWCILEEFSKHDKGDQMNDLYINTFSNKSHEIITLRNIVNVNRNMWSDRTKYFEASFFEDTAHYGQLNQFFPFSNTGRDLSHPGVDNYMNVAKEITDLYDFK